MGEAGATSTLFGMILQRILTVLKDCVSPQGHSVSRSWTVLHWLFACLFPSCLPSPSPPSDFQINGLHLKGVLPSEPLSRAPKRGQAYTGTWVSENAGRREACCPIMTGRHR